MKKAILAISVIALFILVGINVPASQVETQDQDAPGASVVIRIRTVTDRPILKLLNAPISCKVSVSTSKGEVLDVNTYRGGATITIRYDRPLQALFDFVSVTATAPRGDSITKLCRGGLIWDFIPTTYHWPRA
jgi:hypothetical protein